MARGGDGERVYRAKITLFNVYGLGIRPCLGEGESSTFEISDAELKWHSLSVVEWGGRQCRSLQRVAQQKPNPNKQKLLHFHTMRLAALRHYYEKQQQHLMFVISWEEQTDLLFDISVMTNDHDSCIRWVDLNGQQGFQGF
ncbi:hypothetical protein T4E_968 [Trichinella pseudospiralis]|uniref:Uncharacterized protein n=1 Tax=Trichinella pseudospiralis TaxID=6337 RepID=A0A0V0XJT0_TRIPS|nr:hypothetical protein T4E_968 [Trichinella pseudospiralis]